MNRTLPLAGQVLRHSELTGSSRDALNSPDEAPVVGVDEAVIITSEVAGGSGLHKVVLDIDLPVKVVESSTLGHHHLYIDKMLTWGQYSRLLWVLADLGIVEEGYAGVSDARGYTAVRLPWIKKKSDY